MKAKYIVPIIGQVYTNRNGQDYCCLTNTDYPNPGDRQRTVSLGEHQATLVRMSDGWSIVVHGLQQYEDGTVEWNYSTCGAFREDDLAKCQRILWEKAASKKYFAYLDFLRESGTTNMFGAVPYLQQTFPELASDKIKARNVLTAWMDSRSARKNGDIHDNG